MTYTGLPPVTFARDLPAALTVGTPDIWLRDETGNEALVRSAVRNGNTVAVTLDPCSWPAPDSVVVRHIGADDRITTRVY